MTAPAPHTPGFAAAAPAAVVCDEHLLFAEAFAEALMAYGVKVATTTDPGLAVQIAIRNRSSTVVINPEPYPTTAAMALQEIRRLQPRTRLICLGSTSADVPGYRLGQYADLVLSKRRPLRELVEAVLCVPAGAAPSVPSAPRSGRAQCAVPDPRQPLAAQFLNQREREVLRLLTAAKSTQEIARRLGISASTARGYIQSLFGKLGVHSRVEAVTYAVQHSLVEF